MRQKTKKLCYVALSAAVLCIISPWAIPLWGFPVTLSLFAVLLVSSILPTRLALASVLCYVALGAVGIPVFAGFVGGFQVLAGPTGGFIIGYIPVALIVSLFRKKPVKRLISMVFSTILCYIFGALWLFISTGAHFIPTFGAVILTCALPDAIKIFSASLLASALGTRITA